MKLAIDHRKNTFSERWIEYCDKNNITYKIVDCYRNDIFKQLADCDGLLWHWGFNDFRSALCSRQITLSLEKMGTPVFPNYSTSWHFDDKVGQKYFLEAIDAPLVPSHIFYSKKEALEWIKNAEFPKVFKLSGGAGSRNVRLVAKREAKHLAKKAFGSGFVRHSRFTRIHEKIIKFNREKSFSNFIFILKALVRVIAPREFERFAPREKGYIYFQDFIPSNNFDTRLIVIGNRCFAVRRYNREHDFRASGSGIKEYNFELFDKKSIKIAFDIAKKIGSQSLAFDFIKDKEEFKLLEISYAFVMGEFYDSCPGFWDENLQFHQEEVNPQYFIIEDFINLIRKNKSVN